MVETRGSRDLDCPGDDDPPHGLDGLSKGQAYAVKHPTYALDVHLSAVYLYRLK